MKSEKPVFTDFNFSFITFPRQVFVKIIAINTSLPLWWATWSALVPCISARSYAMWCRLSVTIKTNNIFPAKRLHSQKRMCIFVAENKNEKQ